MKNKLLLLLIVAIQITAITRWIDTNSDFPGNFHYSSFDLQLRLIESIHNDINSPIWIVRMFHNKFIGSIFDVYANYLQFWRLQFLLNFISLIGIVGIFLNFYYLFSEAKKRKNEYIILVLFLIAPFIEIFFFHKFSFIVRAIIIASPYLFWSILGYVRALWAESPELPVKYSPKPRTESPKKTIHSLPVKAGLSGTGVKLFKKRPLNIYGFTGLILLSLWLIAVKLGG